MTSDRSSRVRALLTQLADVLATDDATTHGASRWMRAASSPLGARLVRRLVREGAIASARPSKHLLVDRAQHDQWIVAHARDHAHVQRRGVDGDDLDLAIVGASR